MIRYQINCKEKIINVFFILKIKVKSMRNVYTSFNIYLFFIQNIYKFIISVCLFFCPITTQRPLDRFASNFDWEARNVLSLVLMFLVKNIDFYWNS